jgi:hypothetical protein
MGLLVIIEVLVIVEEGKALGVKTSRIVCGNDGTI